MTDEKTPSNVARSQSTLSFSGPNGAEPITRRAITMGRKRREFRLIGPSGARAIFRRKWLIAAIVAIGTALACSRRSGRETPIRRMQ